MSAPQRPTFGKTNPKRVSSLAMRTSHARAMTAPAPTAAPFTAAITGRRSARMDRMRSPVMRVNSNNPGMSRSKSFAMMSWRSPPEQKALPAPVITTARTSGWRSSAGKNCPSSM